MAEPILQHANFKTLGLKKQATPETPPANWGQLFYDQTAGKVRFIKQDGTVAELENETAATVVADSLGVLAHPALFFGTEEKTSNALVTDFLKNECMGTSPLSSGSGRIGLITPTGNFDTHCTGWICRALVLKNGSGERDLAKNALDLLAVIQNADGSWYAQYKPYTNNAGTSYDYAATPAGPTPLHQSGIPSGTSGNWKTELAAASVIHAMADYDAAVAPHNRYTTPVRKALDFLYALQQSMVGSAAGSSLLANCEYTGTKENVAIIGNSAYALLAMQAALDAYSAPLTTSPGGYDVETMANDLYGSITGVGWAGNAARYYNCTYPAASNVTSAAITPLKEKMAWTQGMSIAANIRWANSGYLTATDYSAQCALGIEFLLPLNMGQWGGQFYAPYVGAAQETTDEHAVGAAAMAIAMSEVDTALASTKYANQITCTQNFLKWLALDDGRVFGQVDEDSLLWRWKSTLPAAETTVEGYGFWALPSAMAIMAGA